MRIITGKARGMSLKTLEGTATRPTSEKVKEAVFSAIQFEIEGAKVLDLFAGSGQLGIEALSRGAQSCVFVDSDKEAAKIIKENVEKTRFTENSQIVQMDAKAFLNMNIKTFDIAFVDPPYKDGLMLKILDALAPYMTENALVLCEHDIKEELPEQVSGLNKRKDYKYSKTVVTIYRKG